MKNLRTADRQLVKFEDALREALISEFSIAPDTVARIEQEMLTTGARFFDAAVRIGVVSENEALDATARVRAALPLKASSLVESAIRRAKTEATAPAASLQTAGTGRITGAIAPARDPDDPRSERLRALRTELLLTSSPNLEATIIAVLSPCATEGRSQLAAELAITFSQLGRPTLLVDGDLRRPRQQTLFNISGGSGLAQALATGETPPVYGVDGLPHLHVIPSGPIVANALELLSGERLETQLKIWRHNYDFVVIDTPPITQFADGLAWATVVGRVLVSSRTNVTPMREMKEMLRRLSRTQAHVLGAVLNDF